MPNDKETKSALMEIGVEEVPARMLAHGIENLKTIAEKIFNENAIRFFEIKTYATPRRITLIAQGIQPYQESRVHEVFGPPAKVAFDSDGKLTQIGEKFALSQSVEPHTLKIKSKGKGEYVVAVIEEKGQPVYNIIGGIFNSIISAITFPKAMRWADLDMKFIRPIRWVTAIYGDKPVVFKPVQGSDMESANVTYGHRFFSKGAIVINSVDEYLQVLMDNYVVVDKEERKKLINAEIEEICSTVGAILVQDEELLEHVSFLVEYPRCLLCTFSEGFLTLPRELLISVMKDHQKFFVLENEAGLLINQFIVVSNTKRENIANVRAGAQRVVKARLEDAKFYFDEDRKNPLMAKYEALGGIVFHERIGTISDKITKLSEIANVFYTKLFEQNQQPLTTDLTRAVKLSKCDLVTGVVKEFPELQGIMGRHYAKHDGEPDEVSQAIYEQYLPAFSGDSRLPTTNIGITLSLADKFYDIVSFFAVNLIPTGSEDPFALRRQAFGIISILTSGAFKVSLNELILATCEILSKPTENINGFFKQRLEWLFISKGFTTDTVHAAMDDFMNIPLTYLLNRMNALKELRANAGIEGFLLAIKRVYNILPKGTSFNINENIELIQYEKNLYDHLNTIAPIIYKNVKIGNYKEAGEIIKTIIEPINNFFDNILVMDKDEKIKHNRLAILSKVWQAVVIMADFSKIQY
ncbi:MAG: glycine--tRNA ligase subunit beta [Candidatus Magnetoovum sp. WYHC-5]|nr:glycine--tRNA ligase subunit beta [Candidatus Magnetoovum sp. WYHC-5]